MQLKVCTSTGDTLTFELPADLTRLRHLQADSSFQARVRSMALLKDGTLHVLPVPSCFRRTSYTVEVARNGNDTPAAARVVCYADDVMLSLTVYYKGTPPMARYDARRVGRLRWIAPQSALEE